jgi:hypothetical protein
MPIVAAPGLRTEPVRQRKPITSGARFSCYSPRQPPSRTREGKREKAMDIAVLAQLLSSFATLVVAAGILYQGREAHKARDDEDRPQIIVDVDYTGRFTTNIVVRNIGHGVARNITFRFSAPLQSTSGYDITELPYFQNGINFMAPQTSLPAV